MMKDLIKVNKEQRLYVLSIGNGFVSSLGFEIAFSRAEAMHKWLAAEGREVEPPSRSNVGTVNGYADYRRVLKVVREHCFETGKHCPVELTPQLTGFEGCRVEVVDKYGEKRRFIVGRSAGQVPVHLELPRRNSTWGVAVTGAPFKTVRVISFERGKYEDLSKRAT